MIKIMPMSIPSSIKYDKNMSKDPVCLPLNERTKPYKTMARMDTLKQDMEDKNGVLKK